MDPDRWDRLAESLWVDADEGVDDGLVRAVAEAEAAQVTLRHRLAASDHVTIATCDERISGAVDQVGPDAVVIRTPGAVWIVPFAAIRSIEGLASAMAWDRDSAADRLGFAALLRARLYCEVQVRLSGAHIIRGELVVVGADHVDVVAADGGRVLTCAISAITGVRVASA